MERIPHLYNGIECLEPSESMHLQDLQPAEHGIMLLESKVSPGAMARLFSCEPQSLDGNYVIHQKSVTIHGECCCEVLQA